MVHAKRKVDMAAGPIKIELNVSLSVTDGVKLRESWLQTYEISPDSVIAAKIIGEIKDALFRTVRNWEVKIEKPER